jgi:hypothetical protein
MLFYPNLTVFGAIKHNIFLVCHLENRLTGSAPNRSSCLFYSIHRDHWVFEHLESVTERMRHKCYAICTLPSLLLSLAAASRSSECMWHFDVIECETQTPIRDRKFKTATCTYVHSSVSSNGASYWMFGSRRHLVTLCYQNPQSTRYALDMMDHSANDPPWSSEVVLLPRIYAEPYQLSDWKFSERLLWRVPSSWI